MSGMIDYYLRFETREAAFAALEPLGMVRNGALILASYEFALWEVGEIEGITGWHINLRALNCDVEALAPYMVQPRNPVCVWA